MSPFVRIYRNRIRKAMLRATWLRIMGIYTYHAGMTLRNMMPRDPLLKENRRFHGIHEGETCFIMGSGPSIKTQNLKRLAGQIVMTQNHFHSHEDIKVMSPLYHVVVPMFQPEKYASDWVEWFQGMSERLPQNTTLFAGVSSRPMLEAEKLFEGRRAYVNSGLRPLAMTRARIDITRRIMNIPTVLTECLTLALYMGFSRIYLLGFDLNQVCKLSEDRCSMRFYGVSPITRNQFEKDSEIESLRTGYYWIFYWRLWHQLGLLQDWATQHDRQIVNLTAGGLLEVFPRDSYDKLMDGLGA